MKPLLKHFAWLLAAIYYTATFDNTRAVALALQTSIGVSRLIELPLAGLLYVYRMLMNSD